MPATETFQRWFKNGKDMGATHMIIVCDTFDYDDYPVYVSPEENVREKAEEYTYSNMQKVMEVYSFSKGFDEQFNQRRCFSWE